jgi:hypothetical protein
MKTPEGKLEAFRQVCRGLIARDQAGRLLPLAALTFAGAPADLAEAQAVAGLELLAAGKAPDAVKASSLALAPYASPPKDKKAGPQLRAAVVALAADQLEGLCGELRELYGVDQVKMIRKKELSQPALPDQLQEIASWADFAITGIGD